MGDRVKEFESADPSTVTRQFAFKDFAGFRVIIYTFAGKQFAGRYKDSNPMEFGWLV